MRLVGSALTSAAYMGLRAALVVGTIGVVVVACGGEGADPSTAGGIGSDTNPTSPATETSAPGPSDKGAVAKESEPPAKAEAAALTASPTCASVGNRVVLKLGLTRDHRTPNCYAVNDVLVVFAPEKEAKITLMGPTSDGFCALDVEVPKGAESGKVRVAVGNDEFESDAVFAVPCR